MSPTEYPDRTKADRFARGTMTTPDIEVADLSPGSVLIAGTTGWRYRVQAADPEADRVVLRGPHGSLSAGYREIQRGIASGKIEGDG